MILETHSKLCRTNLISINIYRIKINFFTKLKIFLIFSETTYPGNKNVHNLKLYSFCLEYFWYVEHLTKQNKI
jgi:hypothetical protein